MTGISHFEAAFDAGSVLCRIALWDCFGGEIWSSFLRDLVIAGKRSDNNLKTHPYYAICSTNQCQSLCVSVLPILPSLLINKLLLREIFLNVVLLTGHDTCVDILLEVRNTFSSAYSFCYSLYRSGGGGVVLSKFPLEVIGGNC